MNNTALAIIQPDELDTIQRTAKLLAASGYFATTGDGITSMAQVASKILAGRELGFGPFAAVNGIHIIQGKPTVGANLMAAAVRAHPRYDYKVKTLTDKACVLEFYDGGQLAGESSFTVEEAATAELSTGKNGATWKKFPRNMLFARAMSNGVRWYAPDIFSGNAVYVPEELGADVDGDGNVIEVVGRRVEPDTDEIIDVLTSGPLASTEQLRRLDEVGLEYYKEGWPLALIKWVAWASDAKAGHAEDLSPEQCDAIIEAVEKRIAKRAAAQAQEPIATVA